MKVRLGNVFERQITGEWGNECSENEPGAKVLRTTNFTSSGEIDFKNVVMRSINKSKVQSKRLHYGDIILEKSGGTEKTPVGRVVFCDESIENDIYLCNNFTQTTRVNQVVGYPRYVFYFMWYLHYSGKTDLLQNKTTGIRNLQLKSYLNEELPLPSLDEQRRIAAVLDKVSDLIAKRRAQMDKLDELVKARFVEMFGDPVTNPHRYPVYQLSDYIEFLTSGSRGWAQYFSDEGEYFITIKNVKNCRITLDDVQHIVPPDNAEAVRTKVQEGDLLISITADLGRTGVVTKEIANHGAYINQHLACIRLNQKAVLSLYVACFMESDAGKEQFQAKNQNAVKAGLNFNSINTLRLMVPPIEHQSAFITFVKQIDKLKLTIQQSLDKLEILKKALMQEYFYIGDDENDG